ncbi:MAG: phosphatase PAP2 family protein [Persicimonas sp.]
MSLKTDAKELFAKLRFREFLRRPETRLAAAFLALVVAAWAIAELAVPADDEPHAFDRALLFAFRTGPDNAQLIGPSWVEKFALDLTVLGGAVFVTVLVLVVLGYLLLSRYFVRAAELFVATVGGAGAALGLKELFERPRPDLVPPLYEVTNPSFPSGHATIAAVVYLTLAILMTRFIRDRAKIIYVMIVTALLVFAIGWTRVALGVHYATDVLAGWTLGFAWSLFCWLAIDVWEGRRARASTGPKTKKSADEELSESRSGPTPRTKEQPS